MYVGFCSCIDIEFGNILLKFSSLAAAFLWQFLLKISSFRIRYTIVCSGTLLWLFCPA